MFKQITRWISFLSLALAGAGALVMLALRLGGLDAPLIYDEVFSWITADPSHPFRVVWREVLRADVNVPLFNLLLRGWAYTVPFETVWMRILPTFFSLATIPAVWYLAPKRWTTADKLIFCTLLAGSAAATLYSSVLRTYSLASLLVCVFTMLALRITDTIMARQVASKRLWIAFGITGVLACYSHYFAAGLFFITALFLGAVACTYKAQRGWVLGVTAVAGCCWLLWAGPAVYSLAFPGPGGGIGSGWWFRKGKMLASWEIIEFLLGSNAVKLGVLGFVVAGMTSFVFEERPLFAKRPEVWLALTQIVLLSVAVGIISLRCNLLISRYFLMLQPALLLLLAGLLAHLRTRYPTVIVLLPVFIGVNMVYYLQIYQPYTSDPSGLTELFAYVTHKLHREEVLVAYDRVTYPGIAARWTLEYYLPKEVSLKLTPLTPENAVRMQAPESVPLVAPLSAFTWVMKFSDKYGFDSASDLRQFKQTCLVRTKPK